MPVTLAKQLAAVQRAVINLRGHVANLSGLAERGKRPRIEYEMAAAWFKDLEAAGNTFEMVAKDERIVRFIESQTHDP
jgi:CTP synthase (UTP-ammonia lyase)